MKKKKTKKKHNIIQLVFIIREVPLNFFFFAYSNCVGPRLGPSIADNELQLIRIEMNLF